MTREEVKAVLEMCKVAYPNAMKQISDPKMMIDMWVTFFEPYHAESVIQAVKAHINTKVFFPTIAEIKELADRFEEAVKPVPALMSEAKMEIPFEKSGCVLAPCPYLKEDQTDYCSKCYMEGRNEDS